MSLTPFHGCLATLADSSSSTVFYLATRYQLLVLGLGCVGRVRLNRWYARAAGVSYLLLSMFFLVGSYYAARPVA